MVEAWARWLVRRPVAWFVVVFTLVVAVVSVALSGTVKQDDDLLAFLPKTDPDIAAFRVINEEFGGTDVAMIAVTAPDVFQADVLTSLSAATSELSGVSGLEHVLSMTSVPDFRDDPVTGGIITSRLVQEIPATAEASAALRAHVLSRDQVVGNLVSAEGDAALILAFLRPDAQPAPAAEGIRQVMSRHFGDDQVVYGGGPFIGTYIYETTQADMKALSPMAVGVIIVIMMLAFRDPVGTALGLGATSLGIVVSRAAMAVLGVDFNVVLGSMPVILFAVGSAYAIHVLSHYHWHAAVMGPGPEAVVATLKGTGTTVLAAGLTTVAGLLSFVAMDIEPMQTFGLFTALGIFVALLASLLFVPAFLSLFPGRAREVSEGVATRGMTLFAQGLLRHRKAGRVALLAVFAAALAMVGRVDARMDLSAFFEEGSGPDQAQTLLRERFGGSQFLLLKVQADLTSPEVLREVARIQDSISLVPHVSQVTGAPDLVALVNKAMSGARRIPDTPGQVKVLYRFLDSDPSVSKLVNAERTAGLIQVRIDSDDADDLDAVLAAVETLVAEQAVHTYRVATAGEDSDAVRQRTLRELITGFVALAASYGVDAASAEDKARGFLEGPAPEAPPATVQAGLYRFLTSEESFVVLSEGEATALSNALAPMSPDVYDPEVVAVMAEALGGEEDDATILDLQVVLDGPWGDIRRAGAGLASAKGLLAATGVQPPEGDQGPLFQARLSDRLQDRFNATALLPAAEGPSIEWEVSGMPVLYRGLSRSVTANQFKSLALAMGLVFVLMAALYRSVATGLLAVSPTLFTLAAIYGAMGLFGVQLDIGTSMLASIIIGAGVDYSVHLLAAWNDAGTGDRAGSVAHAIAETSHAIWTNAVMVAAGFFVLTFGRALPLRNVGRLTAAAMLVAAISTFVILPLLARRLRYRSSPDAGAA